MKIFICGAGYVGTSNALLLCEQNDVCIFDIDKKKIDSVEHKDFAYLNEELITHIDIENINISTSDSLENVVDYDVAIIALPTDSDEFGRLNYDSIRNCINRIKQIRNDITIIVKSTMPIGSCEKLFDEFGEFLYIPEFLRESKAVEDVLFPSRVVIGGNSIQLECVSKMFLKCVRNSPVILLTTYREAETIKLFSNTYLALRIAFFNELDSFMLKYNLKQDVVLSGIGLDERIGNFYNNPSFGYGGYCLPKDTSEIAANLDPQNFPIISNIEMSNLKRISIMAYAIVSTGFKKIGIYKLSAKYGSDSIRNSATIKLITELKNNNLNIYIYDPNGRTIEGCKTIMTIEKLFETTDIVLANRIDSDVEKYRNKIFTRDVFNKN